MITHDAVRDSRLPRMLGFIFYASKHMFFDVIFLIIIAMNGYCASSKAIHTLVDVITANLTCADLVSRTISFWGVTMTIVT